MKITIIGCGLIGGSMALALKRRRPEISVACLDLPERIPAIREAGVSDLVGTLDEVSSHVPESSIVILATPVQIGSEHHGRNCAIPQRADYRHGCRKH